MMTEYTQKILLADDEIAITSNIAALLVRAGFMVEIAADGQEVIDKVDTFMPDLVVLDVLMPFLNGREVLRQLRKKDNWLPVILLTQVGDAVERAMALEEGADDYLNKPFDPYELVARIRSILRRVQSGQMPLAALQHLSSNSLYLDRAARRVRLEGQEISLTPKAVNLLEYLMIHPDELMSRSRLLDVVWGWDYPVGERTVDTRIAEIRKAIGDDVNNPQYIETMPGQGYRFIGHISRI